MYRVRIKSKAKCMNMIAAGILVKGIDNICEYIKVSGKQRKYNYSILDDCGKVFTLDATDDYYNRGIISYPSCMVNVIGDMDGW